MEVKRLSNLISEKIGYKVWRLSDVLHFEVDTAPIFVPKNFITDGASCPKILWSLCAPMSGPQAEAAVLHDYLYSKDCPLQYSRKEADDIFYDAMISNGTGMLRAYLIYKGVRIGGGSSFKAIYSIEKLKDLKED